MKSTRLYSILAVLLFIAGVGLMGCGTGSDQGTEAQQMVNKNITPNATLALEVEGMMCSKGCVKAIQSAMAKQDGVSTCVVDYDTKVATIEYDNQLVSESDLIGVFPTIGNGTYKVSKVEAAPEG